ncbi:PIG-L deacetylase family protein [Kocuria rosea]|uniref:PIG-L deacetylase family protein n=1 Tax=Kocuria rosea TaxID=1275 RepID=UPI000E0ED74E|nr:PIG-L deacetylase family protein [Kocuria rosea]
MLLSVAGVLLSVIVLGYIAVGSRPGQHTRLVRGAKPLRNAIIATYTVLLGLNIWCVVSRPGELLEDVVALLNLVATAAWGLVVTRRRIPIAVRARKRRILAVGAHPDDLELACGGTLAKLVDAGHEVRGLVMSSGEIGGNSSMRPYEARQGASFLGLSDMRVLDFPDTELDTVNNPMVKVIESNIMDFGPDVIFTHSAHDQHQDHYAVHQATLRAARAHHSILCFESPSVTRDFDPSVFVDIDGYVDVKVEAVLTHRNQAGKLYMTPQRVRGMAAFRGAQAKNTNAEAFEPVRLLGSAIGDL